MAHWASIHDGYYEVNKNGEIRRAKPGISTFVGRPVLPVCTGTGYMQVTLSGPKKRKDYLHAIVIEAFKGQRPAGMVINHKDGNKQNNRLSNLEYVTHKENSAHALKNIGRRRGPKMAKRPMKGKQTGDKHWTKRMPERIARADRMPHSKMTTDGVAAARERVSKGERQKDVALEYGISVAQMSRIIRRLRWK